MSDVQICNRGLSFIGVQRITSLNESGKAAELCNLHYGDERDRLLSMVDWTFARKRLVLAELTNDRNDWAYKYQRPAESLVLHWIAEADIVRSREASGDIPSQEYQIEGEAIYTDAYQATAQFTQQITDSTKYPEAFKYALSWAIAAAVVVGITEDSRRTEHAHNMAQEALSKALAADAANEVQVMALTPNWIRNRGAAPLPYDEEYRWWGRSAN